MPPCAANLHLHIARSAYVANICINADQLELDVESPEATEEDNDDYDGSTDDALEDEFTPHLPDPGLT